MMPRRLFPRLVLLLGAVLALNSLIGLLLVLATTRDAALQYAVRSFETKIAAADALLGQADRGAADARLQALGIEHRLQPPAAAPRLPPFHRQIERELQLHLPGRSLRLVEAPQPMQWISAERAADGWIGISLLSLRGPLRWSTTLGLVASLLLTFGAAAWYARSLLRPLRTLAAAAPGLAAGEPAPSLPRHAATEIVELATALDRAAADTRTVARERQLMLAGLSHDLRTPLARLVLALELVDGDAAVRAGMAIDLAELDAILDQFIAFVRDGRDEPGQTIDLGALLDDALTAQQRAGRQWQRSGEASVRLYAKPLALRRAIDNLLENGVRHGAAPFEVKLYTTATDAVLSVRDGGPGVAAEALSGLGRPFHRADNSSACTGSGLGLATVARIAAWHGGALHLRNRAEGGFEAELHLVAARS
ncbi:MAG: ATP-binding protein [Rudaea sp.]|nr:ATP-binding protein [Rudaea sp.]